MFASLRKWMDKRDNHDAEVNALATEARDFKVPSETLPQLVKIAFFVGLAVLNFRLFKHTVPGGWGIATGCLAVIVEGVALYCSHYWSHATSWFKGSLGVSGVALMLFSMAHGTASIFDLIGVVEYSDTIIWYSRVVAFPLMVALVGLSVIAICMTHPKNLIRLEQAAAHTKILIGRAKLASELEIMKGEKTLDQAKLDRYREKNKYEAQLLGQFEEMLEIEQRKASVLARVPDPEMREEMARDLEIKLPKQEWKADQTGTRRD